MSRSISIEYLDTTTGRTIDLDVRNPYDLLGCQDTSKQYWANPRLQEFGVVMLTRLGFTDPVDFRGWSELNLLQRELRLLADHNREIDFDPEVKAFWLANLTYCHALLVATAPLDSIPILSIG